MNQQLFKAPGSVFSQINGPASDPQVGPVMSEDPTSNTYNNITNTEGQVSEMNGEYKDIKSREYKDPATQSNTELKGLKKIDKIDGSNVKDTEVSVNPTVDVAGSAVSGDMGTTETQQSRQSSKTGQSWLQRQAMKRLNRATSDATGNIGEGEATETQDADTSTKASKKPGVGRIPAIDQQRPSPTSPEVGNSPNPKVTQSLPKNPAPPPISKVPKFSMPKMKLR